MRIVTVIKTKILTTITCWSPVEVNLYLVLTFFLSCTITLQRKYYDHFIDKETGPEKFCDCSKLLSLSRRAGS